jgi:hypothetical protein
MIFRRIIRIVAISIFVAASAICAFIALHYFVKWNAEMEEAQDISIPTQWVDAVFPESLHLRGFLALHLISVDNLGGEPLMPAIFDTGWDTVNQEALADVALAYGAHVDDRNEGGPTALMKAASNGNPAFVSYLLRHGANPNLEDADGNTPLLLADDGSQSSGWPLRISGLLLAAHADPCHKNHKGETPATHFGLNTPLGRMLDEMCRGTPASPSAHP